MVELIPTFKGVTDHVRLEGVARPPQEPPQVQALAGESAGLFAARLTFPEPVLWLLSLTRVWIETFQDAEVLTVPVYVAAKPGTVTGAWMDPRAADVLRRWPSQSSGFGGANSRSFSRLASLGCSGWMIIPLVWRRWVERPQSPGSWWAISSGGLVESQA